MNIVVEPIQLRTLEDAVTLLELQLEAYKSEAKLLEITDFPPLRQKAQELLHSGESHYGAKFSGQLVGAISYERSEEPKTISISSLVVRPQYYRQGIARTMLNEFFALVPALNYVVQTANLNMPAINLYRSLGFSSYAEWIDFSTGLQLIRLHKHCSA